MNGLGSKEESGQARSQDRKMSYLLCIRRWRGCVIQIFITIVLILII